MRYVKIALGIFVTLASVSGQNLVENHSFEVYNSCPTNYTIKAPGELIPGWRMPKNGTADIFNGCSRFNVGVPSNIMGNMFAADGVGYAGLILLEDPSKAQIKGKPLNYREYLQTELIAPLIKDSLYLVSLWYAPADHSSFLVSSLGILLTPDPVKTKKGVLQYDPQVETGDSSFANASGAWYLLSDTIVATGQEKYITIGNFRTDAETKFKSNDLNDLANYTRRIVEENNLLYINISQRF